ncbi:MAG: PD-(D/E)XK nuclease family protein, partial [Spirochaetaceae bacterium]|nr:PD-(D/E)XK nuclease family protein [Spirochaetaceae bacterium]
GDFLSAYAQSGEMVQFSCSDIGFSGPQLPPGELLSAGAVREVVGPAAVDRGEGVTRLMDDSGGQDLFALEEAYWSGEQKFPPRLYPVQQRGFRFMGQTAFSAKGKDFSKTPVDDPKLLDHLFQVAQGDRGVEDGRFWFSPSSFDQYAGCPFMYLLNRGLKIEEAEFSSQWEDHRFTGIMLHRILTALYKGVQEKDGRWKRENQAEYREMAGRLCREEFDYQVSRGRDFMYPIWKGLQENTRRAVEVFVEQESKLYHGYELAEAEENLEAEIDENCGIRGRVDRISWKEGSAVIVDYKKGDPPSTSDVYPPDSLPPISQLPLYAYAAEDKGYHVTGAAYYSIKNGRYKHMLLDPVAPMDTSGSKTKTMVSPQEFHELKDRIVAAVGAAAEHFSRGVFTTTASCDGCDFRMICRRKYNVRIPEVQQHGKP